MASGIHFNPISMGGPILYTVVDQFFRQGIPGLISGTGAAHQFFKQGISGLISGIVGWLLAMASIPPLIFVIMASGIYSNANSNGGNMLQDVADQFFRQEISGLIPLTGAAHQFFKQGISGLISGIVGWLLAMASIPPLIFVIMASGIYSNANSNGGNMLQDVADQFFRQEISGLIPLTWDASQFHFHWGTRALDRSGSVLLPVNFWVNLTHWNPGLISTTMGWLLAVTSILKFFFGIMASGIPLHPNFTGV
ncbi:hypothetical protein C8R44DRAFT_755302 [Mycena epipterygia]|nr:hypothetical protein C8R44DRAFT_755302 [Mycena epipterygia]